jgi:hypothetical protein
MAKMQIVDAVVILNGWISDRSVPATFTAEIE